MLSPLRQQREQARSSRANARPYNRRRCAAARRRDARRRRFARPRARLGGSSGAMLAPAPGAAEVQPVEMGDLAVAAVADDRRREQGRRLRARRRAAGSARTSRESSPGASAPCTRPRSAPTTGTRRRPAPTPGNRGRRRTSRSARSRISVGQRRVERVRPFEREDQREGGVEMRADADRIGQHRQIVAKPLGEGARPAARARRPSRSSCRVASRWR